MHPTMHSTPTAAKAQPAKPTQAAVWVSATVSGNKYKRIKQGKAEHPFKK